MNFGGFFMLKQEKKKKEKDFLTLEETCLYLGVSKSCVYSWTHTHKIPFYKLHNRKLYFLKDDLYNFLFNDMNRHKSQTELDSEALLRINA